MALILLRHAEPLIEAGICYGQSDIPAKELNEEELVQLVDQLPRPIDAIHTSPLIRCSHLAEQIAQSLGLPCHSDPRLQEIDFGRWEMQPWDDVPRDEVDAWAADVKGARPHGGESVAAMTERVRSYCDEYQSADRELLCVTHLGVVRCAYELLGHDDALNLTLGYNQYVTLKPEDQP